MKKINQMMRIAVLIGLSGTALVAEQALKVPELTAEQEKNMTPEEKGLFAKMSSGEIIGSVPAEIAKYDATIVAEQKDRINQLTAINKKKGYDPTVYQVVYAADGLLDIVTGNTKDIDAKAQNNANLLATVDAAIAFLNQFNPPPPTTFPGKCVAYRDYQARGNIQPSAGVWKITLCFDKSKKITSCDDHTKVSFTQMYQFASDAGTTDGESIENRPPSRGVGTVYFKEEPQYNPPTAKVQCYNPAG